MTALPRLKARLKTTFVSTLSGGVGIDITKENGNYSAALDFGSFAETPVFTSDNSPTYRVPIYNNSDESYSLSSLENMSIAILPDSFSGFANPSGTIGLIASNGSATTAIRSDASPALSQSIEPVWTGKHSWSDGGISIDGAPPQTGTFIGSGLSANFWINQTGSVASESTPEIGAQFTLASNVGSTNKDSAYKIGITGSVVGGSSSANIYGANIITQGYGGSGQYLVTGIESDVNNVGTDATSSLTPDGSPAVFNFVAAGGGTGKVTAHYWSVGVSTAAEPHYSFAASGHASDSSFYDSTDADNVVRSSGTHVNGINLFACGVTGGEGAAFIAPNGSGLGSANAAGNAVAPLVRLNSSDKIIVGSSSYPARIYGTSTDDNASSGQIGEYISSSVLVGSAVALSSGVAKNITSISLTAGDWDVQGAVSLSNPGTSTVTAMISCISTVSETLPTVGSENNYSRIDYETGQVVANTLPCGTTRISIASTTTVYLVAYIAFGVSTMDGFGFLSARRVR